MRMSDCIDKGSLLGNENGVALITSLMLSLFGMLMVAALLFMVNAGTWMSDSQKRYQTVLAAAYGGNEFFVKEIIRRCRGERQLTDMVNAINGVVRVQAVASDADFMHKLTNTGTFDPFVPGDANKPGDAIIVFSQQNGPDINVHATIVNTSIGNAGTASGPQLVTGGVVPSPSGGGTTPHHIPYLYQIQIVAQSAANTRERAQLNSLYVW